MSWQFVGSQKLFTQFEQYERALDEELIGALTDADFEELRNRIQRWNHFLIAYQAFSASDKDPSQLPIVKASGRTFPNFRAFKSNGFTLIYRLESETRRAISLLFYEDSTPSRGMLSDQKHGRPQRIHETLRHRIKDYWQKHVYLRPYLIINSLVFVVGLGGVLIAAYIKSPTEGGRGGIFASILASLSLFCAPDEKIKIFESDDWQTKVPAEKIEQSRSELEELKQLMRKNAQTQAVRIWAVTIGAALGTIFWGWGDVFAGWISK